MILTITVAFLSTCAGCGGSKPLEERLVSFEEKYDAQEEMKRLDHSGKSAIALKLIRFLDSPSHRMAALDAFGILGPNGGERSVIKLAAMLTDPANQNQEALLEQIVDTLAKVGPGASGAVVALSRFIKTSKTGLGAFGMRVFDALEKIGPASLGELVDLSSHPTVSISEAARAAIERINAKGPNQR